MVAWTTRARGKRVKIAARRRRLTNAVMTIMRATDIGATDMTAIRIA
jgi:hypothetical protein